MVLEFSIPLWKNKQNMITTIKKWFLRTFRGPITVTQAKSMGLEFVRNVSGDEINQLGCRSLWKDSSGNTYKVNNLYDSTNNREVGKFFYRIGHPDSGNGLWYDKNGKWTGLAVDKYNLRAGAIPMGYDPLIRNWISVTDTIEKLDNWFTPDEMKVLAADGYELIIFWLEANDKRCVEYQVPHTEVKHWLVHKSVEPFLQMKLWIYTESIENRIKLFN